MSDFDCLLEHLERAVTDSVAGRSRVTVAYSGGLDSSVVALLAQRKVKVLCRTACTRNSNDITEAPLQARSDGLDLEISELADADIERFAGLAAEVLDTENPVRVGYTIPLLAVLTRAEHDMVLVGSCADELFAGYAKYESVNDVGHQTEIDLEKALSELNKLTEYAKSEHKHLAAPFAAKGVVEAAATIPMSRKIGPSGRKLILRDLAARIGAKGYDHPKKAAQYSSGVAKAMDRMAKLKGLPQRDWISAQRSSRGRSQSSNR